MLNLLHLLINIIRVIISGTTESEERMKVKNCLGVVCLLLALCVSLFLNGGVSRESSNLKMTSRESNAISMALGVNQNNITFNYNQISA